MPLVSPRQARRWANTPARSLSILFLYSIVLNSACGLDTPPRSEDHDHSHSDSDIRIGASAPTGGELGADFSFNEPIPLACEPLAGQLLCSATEPGFIPHEEANSVFYPLAEGVPVHLEITAIAPGAQLLIRSETLDSVGDSAFLGDNPEDLHYHPQWQVVSDPETLSATYGLSFRLTTDEPSIADSEEYSVILQPEN